VSSLPDEKGGRFAVGTTAKDESFRLTTYTQNDGAPPGRTPIILVAGLGRRLRRMAGSFRFWALVLLSSIVVLVAYYALAPARPRSARRSDS
jgi:hypothetical protein